MACTPAGSVTEQPLAMATPPAARISATTASAAALLPPLPSRAEPRSLTSTLAPRAASCRAWLRPRPPPAPVTMATRPSKRRPSCEVEEDIMLMGDLVGGRLETNARATSSLSPGPAQTRIPQTGIDQGNRWRVAGDALLSCAQTNG